MPLVLHGDRFWISPFVFSVYVTLKEKGVPFEVVEVALDKQETRRPDYVARTLTGKVPAIYHSDGHDGFWLTESSAIVEYLEEAFPPPVHARVLPAEAQKRARARQVMSWLRTDMDPLREDRSTTTMFYTHVDRPLTPSGQACADRLLRTATALLPDGATTLFGAWSIADSELAFMLQRLALNGAALPPPLAAFVKAQWSRPSVRDYVERTRAEYVPY
jgi:glutathione S-transferase